MTWELDANDSQVSAELKSISNRLHKLAGTALKQDYSAEKVRLILDAAVVVDKAIDEWEGL